MKFKFLIIFSAVLISGCLNKPIQAIKGELMDINLRISLTKEGELKDVKVVNQKPYSTRFEELSDGWIMDKITGLEWGPSSTNEMNWEEAKKYCQKRGGWRLPTVKELQTLVDYEKSDPAIDKDFFPDTKSSYYWTSTTVAGNSANAWVVDFYGGFVSSFSKDSNLYVRPVRSSQ